MSKYLYLYSISPAYLFFRPNYEQDLGPNDYMKKGDIIYVYYVGEGLAKFIFQSTKKMTFEEYVMGKYNPKLKLGFFASAKTLGQTLKSIEQNTPEDKKLSPSLLYKFIRKTDYMLQHKLKETRSLYANQKEFTKE